VLDETSLNDVLSDVFSPAFNAAAVMLWICSRDVHRFSRTIRSTSSIRGWCAI
jgi:hypothetical protein